MKRIFTLLIFIALCLAFLSGCSSSEITGSYKNMEVIESESTINRADCNYTIKLKRGNTKIDMCATRSTKKLLVKGNIVDVYYDKDLYIQKVKFPEFEGDKAND